MEHRNKRPQKAVVFSVCLFCFYSMAVKTETERDTLLLPLLLPSEAEFKLQRVPLYKFSPVQT